jgi:hypothetical protein
MAVKDLKFTAERLRNTLDPGTLGFETTDEIQPSGGMIGQPRALQALEFGLRVDSDGYNVYVSGAPGTGKMTATRQYLAKLAPQRPTPPDWCYVYNFDDADCPRAVSLAAGWQLYRSGRLSGDGWLAGLGAGLLAGQAALGVHGLVDAITWGMVRPAPLVWALWRLAAAGAAAFHNPY